MARETARLAIEPARLADAEAIAHMSRDTIERDLPWRWRPGAIRREIRDPDALVILVQGEAEAGRAIDAFAAMRFDFEALRAHLLLLAVAPERRRCGLATALLGWLETVARRGGIAEIDLEVRIRAKAARACYEHLGYGAGRRIRGYYQGREDAIVMSKRLRFDA